MDQLKELVEKNAQIVIGLLLVLVLLVFYLLWTRPVQGFMPGATLRYQKLDGLGFEGMAGDKEAPGQAVKEGSPAWNVLHSADFGCDKRAEPNDDAWTWMYNQRNTEGAVGGRRPRTDDDLSKIAAGQ